MTTQTPDRAKTRPIAGDVLERDGRRRYVVAVHCDGAVIYHRGDRKQRACLISAWRDWARTAEVVSVGTAA